jgi:membrane-associated phospholipid phosphatase
VLAVAAVVLGWFVRGTPSPAELALSETLVRTCPPWIASLGELIGSLPVFAGLSIAAAVVTLLRSAPGWTAAFLVGAAVELPVEIVKILVDRARPATATGVEAFGSLASYPSGHTARMVVLAGLLVAWLAWNRGAARWPGLLIGGVATGFVGFARIGGGAHWPTDVLGGILLGAAWLVVALWLGAMVDARRFARRGGVSPR